ncbi:MAG: alpha/beta fold hydrolase [Acidobacteriota bacterium]
MAAGLVAVLTLAGCVSARTANVPMSALSLPGSDPRSRCAVVFLPGRWDHPADFTAEGFPTAAAEQGAHVAMVAADAGLQYYLGGTVVERLERDIVAPLRAAGHDRVWLVGVSMGGLGALLTLRRHSDQVTGVVVLAPFLGDRKVVREIVDGGGLATWSPPESLSPDDYQRRLWTWLKTETGPGPSPPIWLAYGEQDKLATSAGLLAARLPTARVFTTEGGHDWRTWRRLWGSFLASGVLQHSCKEPAPTVPAAGSESAGGSP